MNCWTRTVARRLAGSRGSATGGASARQRDAGARSRSRADRAAPGAREELRGRPRPAARAPAAGVASREGKSGSARPPGSRRRRCTRTRGGGSRASRGPRSAEPQLLLQLLEVALDPPAQLGGRDQPLQRGGLGQGREPVLRRLLFPLRPLGQEPLLGPRFAPPRIAVRRPDPDGGEARGQLTGRALAPSAAPPRARG